MGMEAELVSIPATPRGVSTPETVTPSGQRSPLPRPPGGGGGGSHSLSNKSWTPTPAMISPRFLSPSVGTPVKRVLVNLRAYLEEVGHLTRLNPQDAWLPITESRNGNAHYAAFHNLNAGIGFQALVLPVAFAFLGWYAPHIYGSSLSPHPPSFLSLHSSLLLLVLSCVFLLPCFVNKFGEYTWSSPSPAGVKYDRPGTLIGVGKCGEVDDGSILVGKS